MQHAKVAECGVPGALADPYLPGHCVILGDLQFSPTDFLNPVVKQDDRGEWGVGLTLTHQALAVFQHEIDSLVPNAPPDPTSRLLFVFKGQPLRWTSLPEADATVFVVTPSQALAQRIATSLHR
jgi:hypothetical protein